jgi:glutamate N-acetyltransferase / amino-acid N-acetyltransferase
MKGKKIEGGVCAARGFMAAATASGLKAGGGLDLCILVARERCAAAATFTTNAFRAAPVLVTREHLEKDGFLRAAVVNAGNANAWTGERGMKDARSMAEIAGCEMGIDPTDVAVASTGVIGRYLDMEKIASGIEAAASRVHEAGSAEAARAIMTTDTYPKEAALDCDGFFLGGMAKGSGMIKPDMATMLAFITTDAAIEPEQLAMALRSAVESTFNRITVDGCTSTNDMVLAMASGEAGIRLDAEEMGEPLRELCSLLARDIVAHGEGATRFVTVRVHEAADEVEAKRAAMEIAESSLVKSALFGGDPNWGRIVQSLGQAIKDADPAMVRVGIGGATVAEAGLPVQVEKAELEAAVAGSEVAIDVYLGRGGAETEVWTCDLSYDYVKINAEYHT